MMKEMSVKATDEFFGGDNLNRIGGRITKLVKILNIDLTAPDAHRNTQHIYAALRKQHEITKKNIIRLLKNKHVKDISNTTFEELKNLSISNNIQLNIDMDKYHRHQCNNENAYDRKGIVLLEYVHKYVGLRQKLSSYGIEYNIKSPRFFLYKKTTTCVHCGIEGKYYALEQTAKRGKNVHPDWHLNLYGIKIVNGKKFEVILTQDHIIPKSKGGPHIVENLQTMCGLCNRDKDSINDEIFKNGNSSVTFKNINNVAQKFGIKLVRGDQGLFWSGSDENPNTKIYQLNFDYKMYDNDITIFSWVRWMSEIENVVIKLYKVA